MGEFLFRKKVDKSLLKSGLTIPVNLHNKIIEILGINLQKGEKSSVSIVIENINYDAIINNVNFSLDVTNRTVLQIRYAEGNLLCKKLREIFNNSYKYFFEDAQETNADGDQNDLGEFIEIYYLGDKRLEFKCFPKEVSMKDKFLAYLGDASSLAGYQRSYKLVFYKSFFENISAAGEVSIDNLVAHFKQYYLTRIQSGFITDVNVDKVIENIERSNFDSIYKLILRNPFDAISKQGFIIKISKDNSEYFKLQKQLFSELSKDDVQNIIEIVNKKLELYYGNCDSVQDKVSMKNIINKILDEYIEAKNQIFAGNQMGIYFRNDIPQGIYATGVVDKNRYLVTGSVGQGNWATVPWICIFDKNITTTATKGVYIVYLLSKDGNTLYLTFNQGCTDIRNSHNKRETIAIMRNKAAEISAMVDSRGFCNDENINLGTGLTELAELYQKGTIFYKAYHKNNVPEEAELRDDLAKMISIYQEYVMKMNNNDEQIEVTTGGDDEMSIIDSINNIKSYISAKGFNYNDGLIENFYLSLKSKPFVILAGTSGTGKTRLVKLFAEAVGATSENGRYKMVPVRPDWSDSSDLFGHVDLNGKFIPGAIIDFVKQAEIDCMRPYFLCLDEMNLARVEYYLSDILSVIETRDFVGDKILSEPLVSETFYGPDRAAADKYGVIKLPENLYIIGTVNMDETTFPFSRKVLDRANTIEFSYVDLMPDMSAQINTATKMNLNNKFLKTDYLLLNNCSEDIETVNLYCAELQKINRILQQANAHVGYRVRDEIIFYVLNNKKYNLLDENKAFDNEIMQKILPRIHGSSISVKRMLCDLFKYCAGDYDGYSEQSDNLSEKMKRVLRQNDQSIRYRHSAEKIELMTRRIEEDGFTSYWL